MSLLLERQTSSSTEMVNDQEVCVVVKQSIFTLTITSQHRIDGEIVCELVYDNEEFRPVGFIAQKPMFYRINPITQNTINVECKLSVLSSKHEDLLFRVLVKQVIDGSVVASIYSKPIKSTSKADSHKKVKEEAKPKKNTKKAGTNSY